MELVRAEGYDEMLYTYNNYLRDYLDASRLDNYKLWLANYLEHPSSYGHHVWQHSNWGRVSGIAGPVDLNVSYEDLSRGGFRADREPEPEDDYASDDYGNDSSSSISDTLYSRYGVDISLENSGHDEVHYAITTGIQSEIGRQWGINYEVNGDADSDMIDYLSEVNYTPDTHGNIMYLIQTKLRYLGYYSSEPSSWNDAETRDAISRFQSDYGLYNDGYLGWDTLAGLLL
jgi:hypothetical protein